MRDLYPHQKDGLTYAYLQIKRRLTEWSDLLYDEPPEDAYKYVRKEWEDKVRDAEAACGVLISHEMGLGKTASFIRLAKVMCKWVRRMDLHPDILDRFKRPKVLVVVPNIAKLNWQREWKMWNKDGEDDRLYIINSNKDEFASAMLNMMMYSDDDPEKIMCMVMSYDTLRCRLPHGLLAIEWDIIAFDEIQAFRNTQSQRTQAGMQLRSKLRVGLSGTPYTNKPDQLWSALSILQGYSMPVHDWKGDLTHHELRSPIWESKAEFVRKYCRTSFGRYGAKVVGGKNLTHETCELPCCRKQWKQDETGRWKHMKPDTPEDECQALHLRLKRELMHRVRTEDAIDLPPWTLVDVPVEMTKAQETTYNRLLDGLLMWIDTAETDYAGRMPVQSVLAQMTHAFTTCAHLGQLANGIAKKRLGDENITELAGITGNMLRSVKPNQLSGKLNWLLEFVYEQLNDDKMIIVTEFRVTAELVQKALDRAGCRCTMITGAVKNEQRDANVRSFMENPDVRAIIINKAGYEAINLNNARYVILFGKVAWTPGEMLQAIKRAHRIGTKGTVTVLRLYHEGTIECWLNKMLGAKAADFSSAIDGGATTDSRSIGSSFTSAELVDIFQGRVE